MKRIAALILTFTLLLFLPALGEEAAQTRLDSGFVGVWIETEGYGTLTIGADGTARMDYYDGTVTETTWGLTENGYHFGDGMWYNSPMELLDENTLSVSNGWMVFAREGFLPTTDDALLLGAQPVGEEGEPFLGDWELTMLVIDGEEIDPALFSMTMSITFNTDGTVVIDDDLEPYTTTWSVSYGNAVVEGDILVLDENDQLRLTASDGTMVFSRVQTEESDPTNPIEGETDDDLSDADQLLALLELLSMLEGMEDGLSELPENHQGFVGEWHLCYVMTGGLTGDLRSLGIIGTLTLNTDYTGELTGLADEYGAWYEDENGVIRFGESGMPLFLLGDVEEETGLFLQYGTEAGGCMIFHQDEEAVWVPGVYELATPADNPDLIAGDAPAQSAGSVAGYTDIRFVCTSYTAAGFTMDASALGAEYALLFHGDGTADFTMAGFTMEKLPYTITDDGAYAINYYGTMFSYVPTETGFDMDYYGTMIMHFTPAQ